MDLFSFTNYKEYTLKRFESMPKRGHGQLKKLAEYLNVHTTYMSQVFNGDRLLNPEQAMYVAEYLGLTELETEYYIKLVQIERAGNDKLKRLLIKEAQKIKERSQQIRNRLTVDQIIPDTFKSVFYSDWYYSAIRLLTSIKGYQDIESISNYFNLPRFLVRDVTDFLLRAGLLEKDGDKLKLGPSSTHLSPDTPFIKLHHLNWRQKALECLRYPSNEKLHYSSPMTLSKKDAQIIRDKLVKLVEDVVQIVDSSPAQELMCLNIDWFNVHPDTETRR